MFLRNKFIVILFFLVSCQPIELVEPVNIDNTRLLKISISSNEIVLNINYNPVFSENNIEDQIENPPIKIITSWINENISNFGNENKLVINIIDASIFKKEIDNVNAKKYEEKTIFKYDVFFLVEYELYDDSNYLIANTSVESSRSTTSQKYISINETEIIINDLLNKAIEDFTKESEILLKKYLSDYLK